MLNNFQMKTVLNVVAVAALALALTQSVQATPITGVIGFSGTATLDGSTAASSTEVMGWGNNSIGLTAGTFASLSSAATVALAGNWFFDSGKKNNFWVVTDGASTYTFNLTASSIFGTSTTTDIHGKTTTSISIFLAGTVVSSVLGLNPTAWTGSMTVQDPNVVNQRGGYNYTESISFNSVPDGGTTVLLLGSALSGLALLRRK